MGLAFGPPAGLDQGFGQAMLVAAFLDRDGLVGGVVVVVPSEQLVGPTVQFAGDDGAPFGVELAGDLGHALTVLPAAQPVLGLHPFPLAAPVILGVPLHELIQPLAELEGRLAGSGGEQLRFVLIQGGPSRRDGLGSGMRDGFGVFVGDGPVLEGVLGLGELTELGGGLGPPFGLPDPAVLLAVQPVSVVLGWIGRVGVQVRRGSEPAGFAARGPGPQGFGQSEGPVDIGAGSSGRFLPEVGHGRVWIEHQYYSISPGQWVQVFVREISGSVRARQPAPLRTPSRVRGRGIRWLTPPNPGRMARGVHRRLRPLLRLSGRRRPLLRGQLQGAAGRALGAGGGERQRQDDAAEGPGR